MKNTTCIFIILLLSIVSPVKAEIFDNTFNSGWHLISLPCSFKGSDPGTIFGDPFEDVYGLEDSEFLSKDELTTVVPARGYWVHFENQTDVSLDCISINGSDYTVKVTPGWNMVGSPFSMTHWNEATIDDVLVEESSKILSPLYSYDNSLKAYKTAGLMTQWSGYFVKAGESGTLKVTPATENNPPVADAGPDEKWFVGKRYEFSGWDAQNFPLFDVYDIEYTLDGSGSSDPDGDALSYSWTQTAGPAATLSNPNDSMATFVTAEEATYTFQLEISDGQYTDMDEVSITAFDFAGKLAFRAPAGLGGGDDIYLLDFETSPGEELKKVTNTAYHEVNPYWNATGSRIFVSTNKEEISSTFYLSFIDPDGTNQNVLDIEGFSNDWSPSGSKVLFDAEYTGAYELFEMIPENGAVNRLTSNGVDSGRAQYSNDETSIAYIVDHGGTDFPLKVMDADGNNNVYLLNDGNDHGRSRWSNSGQIIFEESNNKLVRINPDGSGRETMLTFSDLGIGDFTFNDDETVLFFCDSDITSFTIHVMFIDGTKNVDFGLPCITMDYYPGP